MRERRMLSNLKAFGSYLITFMEDHERRSLVFLATYYFISSKRCADSVRFDFGLLGLAFVEIFVLHCTILLLRLACFVGA